MSYKPFMVAPFTSGMDKSFEPWLTPDKAFTELYNVYVDRGIIKKRGGASEFGRLGLIVEGLVGFVNVAGNNYTKTATSVPIIPNSLFITDVGGTMVAYDDGEGSFSGSVTGTTSVNYATGEIDITFSGAVIGTVTAEYHYSEETTDRNVRGIHVFDESDGTVELLALDKRRLNRWNTAYEYFNNVSAGTAVTSEAYDTGDGSTGAFAHTASNLPVIPFTVSVSDAATGQVLYDNGFGNFVYTNDLLDPAGLPGTGTIDYVTGVMSVTFNTVIANPDPIVVSYRANHTPTYDIWNSSNLTWSRAYKDVLWLTDNISNINIYNGDYAIDITPRLRYNAAGHMITSARSMQLFRERPVLFNTVENGIRYAGRARWSAAQNPFTVDAWRSDVDGQGDYSDVTTNDEIVTTIQLKDRTIVFLENDIAFFLYTGNPDMPYRWQMLNSRFKTASTFGFFDFDQYVVSLNRDEMVACDGVTAKKANTTLPQFTLDIDYDNISKCFGHVISHKHQAWLAYPSNARSNLGYCDKILVFNYDDDIISSYDFSDADGNPLPINCLCDFNRTYDTTFRDINTAKDFPEVKKILIEEGRNAYYSDYAGMTYGELEHQSGDQITLSGGDDGRIYILDDENSPSDNGIEYNFDIVTKRYNPYSEAGKMVSLGHIDFLVSSNAECEIEVNFCLGFTDNITGTLTTTFICDGVNNKVWRRVYCNAIDDVISFNLSHPEHSLYKAYNFELHSFKLGFKEGGNII